MKMFRNFEGGMEKWFYIAGVPVIRGSNYQYYKAISRLITGLMTTIRKV